MATKPKTGQDKPDLANSQGLKAAGWLMWLMVGVIAAASFALPTVLLLCPGMFPTLVAMIVDRHRDNYTPMAVGTLNLAGLLP